QNKAQAREVEEDEKTQQQGKETAPIGTCQSMCPARELRDREAQSRLHRFEVLAGTERARLPRGDPSRAVKEYSRPAAGKDTTAPTNLRPPDVLLKTVHYLIDDIAASLHLHPWTEQVYSFVFDRLRGVKQDMIIQRVSGPRCVAILEPVVRFLIYASYRLCGEPLRRYDPCINETHLQENLSWLLDCYATGTGPHPNQEEFQALGLLYNLSARATQHILELPKRLRSSPAITLAVSINKAFLERNPVCLLRLAQRLSFLQSCALHRHLVACRRDLLLIYSHGYSSRNCRFPLNTLAQLLSLDTSLTAQLCQAYGLTVIQDNEVVFSKAAFTEAEQEKL
uniref:SAC3/GANP/THP3 conserved domain-containing protein n=1 Tax=Mola mola TaxID=94237 RepID=A0A3Q4BXG8_MOLML